MEHNYEYEKQKWKTQNDIKHFTPMTDEHVESSGFAQPDVKKRRVVATDSDTVSQKTEPQIVDPFNIGMNKKEELQRVESSEKVEKGPVEKVKEEKETTPHAEVKRRKVDSTEETNVERVEEIKPPSQEKSPRQQMPMRYPESRTSPDDADLTDAMVFLNKIKEDCKGEGQVYDQFLETMRDFKFGKVVSNEVCKRVAALFTGKPHLKRMFEDYLPHHLKTSFCKTQMDNPGVNMPMQNGYRPMPHFQQKPGPYAQMPENYQMQQPPYPHPPVISPVNPSGFMQPRPMQRPLHPIPNDRYRMMPSAQPNYANLNDKMSKKDKHQIFIEKLKKKYSPNNVIYNNIIDAMLSTHTDAEDLFKYVKSLLKDDPELFNDFKVCCDPDHKILENMPKAAREKIALEKIKHIMESKGVLGYFTMILNYYNQGLVPGKKLFYLLDIIIDNNEYMTELKSYLGYKEEKKSYRTVQKETFVGSYAKRSVSLPCNENNLHNLLLNHKYVCLNTHISEDDEYVFRERNRPERNMASLGEDRFEFDVQIQRLKCFICRLLKLHVLLPEEPKALDVSDLDMSTGIVKDVLKMIYGDEHKTMLEKILENGKVAIPKIIKRCCIVYKEFLTKQKENRINWRAITEMYYFKACDIDGIEFRDNEKNNLNMRHIKELSKKGFTTKVLDKDLLKFLHTLLKKFMSTMYNQSKVVSIDQKLEFIKNVFANINSNAFEYSVNLDYYGLYYFILVVYERFKEIKEEKIEVEEPSKVALKLGLVEPNEFDDAYKALMEYSMQMVSKTMDESTFEENVRIYTKCKGYKLYNLKKFLAKIDKLSISIIEKAMENNDEGMDLYIIQKNSSTFNLKRNDGVSVSEDIGEILQEGAAE